MTQINKIITGKRNLFITGGSGFVGGHVMTQALTQKKWEVMATYQNRSFSFPGVKAHPLNLSSEKERFKG